LKEVPLWGMRDVFPKELSLVVVSCCVRLGGELGVHISSQCYVVQQGVNAALNVGLAQLSVAVWWVVFLVVNGVVFGNGRMRGVPEEMGRGI